MSEHTDDADDAHVVDNPDRARFEIRADGELAGWAEYQLHPGRVVFTHTETGERFQGRGLAGRLVRAALDSVRERGLQVTPQCPYVAGYIRKHPEYVPLVDDRHRPQFTRPASE